MNHPKLALVRTNYSQLYHYFDDGKTYAHRDILVPYQLITLAAHIRRRAVDVRVFDGEVDLSTQEQLAQAVVESNPGFVGVTATTPDVHLAIDLCDRIKRLKGQVVTILGGSHASAMPDDVAQHSSVDYVVVGDGEFPLDLIINSESGGALSRHISRELEQDQYAGAQFARGIGKVVRGRLRSLRRQPMPAHDILDYSKYQFSDPTRGRVPTASVMSTRGCPFECKFCFHDRLFRDRPVDHFLREVTYLVAEKGVKYFYIYDDTFTCNRPRAMRILETLARADFGDVKFQCLTRGDQLDEELVDAMRRAGFVRVSCGLESGSDTILRRIGKNTSRMHYRRSIRLLKDAGIETRASFIIGHPYETETDVKATMDFATEIDLVHANFNLMTPYPGTSVYEMALRNEGISFDRREYATDWKSYRRWGKAMVRTEQLSAQDLEWFQREAHRLFYTQDGLYEHYYQLFKGGNRSRFFYRPLNDAWNHEYGHNVPFWNDLEEDSVVDVP